MSPGPTFERVYHALKEQLRSGRFVPGEQLEPAQIGEELCSSITPVRDALHRLVGERIVEAPRNDGFRIPAVTEADLRHLYGWNHHLLELALRSRPKAEPGFPAVERVKPDPGSEVDPGRLFAEIVDRQQNPEAALALQNLNDRLAALRAAERRLFDDHPKELGELRAAFQRGDISGLRRRLLTYHRRRQKCASQLLMLLRHGV